MPAPKGKAPRPDLGCCAHRAIAKTPPGSFNPGSAHHGKSEHQCVSFQDVVALRSIIGIAECAIPRRPSRVRSGLTGLRPGSLDISRDHASQERRLNSELLRKAIDTFEIIETYPDDKYLPSFLLRGEVPEFVFHALVATDSKVIVFVW